MTTHGRHIATVILATLTLLVVSWVLFNREYVDSLEATAETDDGGYLLTTARDMSLRCDELGINDFVDRVRTGWKELIGMATE